MSSFKDAVQKMMGTGPKKILSEKDKNMMAGKRVLIAEDIDINQMVLVKLLGTMGAECDVAWNGQEAVEKYVSSPADGYDIILMDIQMPVMNGYEAARAIRASAHPGARTIPIIAMSANAFMDDVRNALNAGMDAHISKPIIFEEFRVRFGKCWKADRCCADRCFLLKYICIYIKMHRKNVDSDDGRL